MSQQQIIVSPEYEKLIPEVANVEFEELKESIRDNGLYESITINGNGIVLDGHHRLKAWKALGKKEDEIPYRIKNFDTPLKEKRFVIESNLRRRHLQLFQKAALALELKKIESEEARLRQIIARENTAHSKLPKDLGNLTPEEKQSKLQKAKINREKRKQTQQDKPKPERKPRVKKEKTPEENKKKKEGQSRQRAAKTAKLSDESLRQYEYVLGNCKDQELINDMKTGYLTISKAYDIIKRKEKVEEAKLSLESTPNTFIIKDKGILHNLENPCVMLGDFFEESKNIPDNFVDLIFTDPPYDKESLDLYSKLAEVAGRVLKPGGSLVTYCGSYWLDEVYQRFWITKQQTDLRFWWHLSLELQGIGQKAMGRSNITIKQKPLLWFVKGDKPSEFTNSVDDLIHSQKPDKSSHPEGWEQNTIEAEYIISKLTIENQIVFDPFAGTGTTVLAALEKKRKCISFEKDEHVLLLANQRIFQSLNDRNLK